MIKYISKTQLNMYARCPFQWYCRYIQGLKIPPNTSLLLGSCYDASANLAYSFKKEKGKEEKVSVLQDCFADVFDNEKPRVFFDEGEKPGDLKDLGIKTVATFHKDLYPNVIPKEIQMKGSIKFSNVDYELVTIVDLIDIEDEVIDNKTTKKRWSVGQEFKAFDPVIYSLWFENEFKKPPKEFRFDIAIMKAKPEIQQVSVKVSEEEKQGFLKYTAYVVDSINKDSERGVFLPRYDSFLCSKKKCGYWAMCQKDWGKVIKP